MKARLFGAIALMMASLQVNGATPVKIYLNQVGYYPDEEKVVVLEGIDEKAKLTVSNSKGKVVLKPNVTRKAVSPWSEKTRFIVDISGLKTLTKDHGQLEMLYQKGYFGAEAIEAFMAS